MLFNIFSFLGIFVIISCNINYRNKTTFLPLPFCFQSHVKKVVRRTLTVGDADVKTKMYLSSTFFRYMKYFFFFYLLRPPSKKQLQVFFHGYFSN